MPQSLPNRVAEQQDLAAHAHDKAAVSHQQNDHLSAHELSKESQEKSREAHERGEQLVKEAESGK